MEARLMALVLNGVTSEHSRRSYRTGLARFFAWIGETGQGTGFPKAVVQQYRAAHVADGLSASTITSGSPHPKTCPRTIRQPNAGSAGRLRDRVYSGCQETGNADRNWLMKDQANQLLNAPDPETLAGRRDRAMLALLLGCGLRRGELLRLDVEDL